MFSLTDTDAEAEVRNVQQGQNPDHHDEHDEGPEPEW